MRFSKIKASVLARIYAYVTLGLTVCFIVLSPYFCIAPMFEFYLRGLFILYYPTVILMEFFAFILPVTLAALLIPLMAVIFAWLQWYLTYLLSINAYRRFIRRAS